MNYDLEKKYHVSFCGSYCHICDWHTGRIRKAFQLGLDMIDSLGLKKQLGDVDIKVFKKGLRRLANSSVCPGCKADAGTHGAKGDRCKIRACCYGKGYDLCNECSLFPCEMLKNNPGVIKFHCIENLNEINEKGIKYWLDRQWDTYVTGYTD